MKKVNSGIVAMVTVVGALGVGAFTGPVMAAQAQATQAMTAKQARIYKAEKVAYVKFLNSGPVHTAYHRASPHLITNVTAENPISCDSPQAKTAQPMKWATFCANGGGR